MTNPRRIHFYVGLNVLSAGAAMVLAWRAHNTFPGLWEIVALLLVGFLLEVASTTLRSGEGKGSISFVSDLAAGLLFGAFWAGAVAALSMGLSQIWNRRPTIRLAFNVAQRTLSSVIAIGVFSKLGGSQPFGYFLPGAHFEGSVFLWDLACFTVGALSYFTVNSLAVSGALSIAQGVPLRSSFAQC